VVLGLDRRGRVLHKIDVVEGLGGRFDRAVKVQNAAVLDRAELLRGWIGWKRRLGRV